MNARRRCRSFALLICLALVNCSSRPPRREAASATAADLSELWVAPADLAARDLYYGIGGVALAPDPDGHYRHLSTKHEIGASSPGYKVRDDNGTKWNVKLGDEVQAEVVASRLIWAAGYHQLPVYYVDHWRLEKDGASTPQPAARFRPYLRAYKRREGWHWKDNPFVGTQPYRGLIVLMLMLNNWDLTTENNSIYDLRQPWDGAPRWYIVRDVGASFSRNRGTWFQGTRGDLPGFAREGFIDSVDGDRVIFAWSGLHQDLLPGITASDVRWIADRLAALRPDQWEAATRAGGYTEEQRGLIRRKLAERIEQARRL